MLGCTGPEVFACRLPFQLNGDGPVDKYTASGERSRHRRKNAIGGDDDNAPNVRVGLEVPACPVYRKGKTQGPHPNDRVREGCPVGQLEEAGVREVEPVLIVEMVDRDDAVGWGNGRQPFIGKKGQVRLCEPSFSCQRSGTDKTRIQRRILRLGPGVDSPRGELEAEKRIVREHARGGLSAPGFETRALAEISDAR